MYFPPTRIFHGYSIDFDKMTLEGHPGMRSPDSECLENYSQRYINQINTFSWLYKGWDLACFLGNMPQFLILFYN